MSIDLPTGALQQTVFALREYTATAGIGSPVVQSAPARWTARYETGLRTQAIVGPAVAFVRAQRGGVGTFWGYDCVRPWPITYRTGFAGLTRHAGGSFDGTATVTARTATTLSLSGLPSTFALKVGDLVGLVSGANRSLHAITADATASAGVVTVSVVPPIDTVVFTTAATATFDRPRAVFRIDPGSISTSRRLRFESVAFEATQVLYG